MPKTVPKTQKRTNIEFGLVLDYLTLTKISKSR